MATEPRHGRIVVLCLLQFLDVMGTTMVLTLLPTMLAEVRAEPAGATFLSTGYAVAFGGCLILGARLGDRFGHVRMIVVSSCVFAAAGLLVAFSPSLTFLTVGRVLQGLAAAVTVPAALFLITQTTAEGPARKKAVAAWSAAGAAAGASGFIVGGLASATDQWRSSFLILGLLGGALGLLTGRMFGGIPAHVAAGPLGIAGGAVLTVAVGLTVTGTALVQDHPHTGLWLGAAALAAGIWLAVIERASAKPILPPRILRSKPVRFGAWVSFTNTATTSSAAAMVTLSLQEEHGRSGLATAAVLLPFSVAVVLGSLWAPVMMSRKGDYRTMGWGLAGIGTGTAFLPLMPGQLVGIGVAMALSGAGIGLSSAAATHTGTNVPAEIRAAAAAVVNTAAQLGTALGVALSLAMAAQWGYTVAWAALAILAVAAAAGVGRLRTGPKVI